VVRGAEQIARNARVGARPGALVHPAVADGLPGLLVTMGGKPVTVLAFTVADGRITTIRALTDPGRLAQRPLVGRVTALTARPRRRAQGHRRLRRHLATRRLTTTAACRERPGDQGREGRSGVE
jgi:hypothetical protein